MSGVFQFLSPLVHPLGFAWLLLLVAAVIFGRRRNWRGAGGCTLAAAVLWFITQPAIGLNLFGRLERPWLDHTVAQAPAADAVIVLGGGWRLSGGDFSQLDLTPSADRLIVGIELNRSGRAPALVVGGDSVRRPEGFRVESQNIRSWLERWGIAPAEFFTLGPVANTRDEARRTRELVDQKGWKRVLLVTSALHMRRALAVFRKAGVPAEPVACDFQIERETGKSGGWCVFPNQESLTLVGLWWHEQLGWYAYRLFGYI